MKILVLSYVISLFICCILGIIFSYRVVRKYEAVQGKFLLRISLLLFVILIPIINISVYLWYSINLFEREDGFKIYKNKERN